MQLINKIIQIDHLRCARCRNCVRKCPKSLLELINDKQGLHLEIKDSDQCFGCHDCVDACHFNAIKLIDKTVCAFIRI